MSAREIVKKRFIDPFQKKKIGTVGVELEFPLVNFKGQPLCAETAKGLLSHFLSLGFFVEDRTTENEPAFIRNRSCDTLSFDNSYNNFEFAMHYGGSLLDIEGRFRAYFQAAQDYLLPRGHLLTGMGTNPYRESTPANPVGYPIYDLVRQFLHTFPARHRLPDFPAYLSSVQTHLDVPLSRLPEAYSLFARLDFVRAAFFANSPALDGSGVLCERDSMWQDSAFPNTGAVDGIFRTQEDLINDFLKRKLFVKLRSGQYEPITPISLDDYFAAADEKDINQFLSFRHVEITARGTLEIRSDCTQPVRDAFIPPAFSLGILHNMKKAEKIMEGVYEDHSTSQLRDAVIHGHLRPSRALLTGLAQCALEGLKGRKKGEEVLLTPIFHRIEEGLTPAEKTLARLKNKEAIEGIVWDCAAL